MKPETKPETRYDMKNDYCQYYVDTGERPQNFIRDILPSERFKDYPKLDELIKLKDKILHDRNHPPMCLGRDLREVNWSELGQFDVIMVDPPWMEYKTRIEGLPVYNTEDERLEGWTKEDIATLQIDKVSKTPSFLFLWVGSEHLDDGRELLKHWGFKRCEDVVWLKTNRNNKNRVPINEKHFLQHVKEHCLVGVKGDVRRASDSHFIHANIDTDVIVSEELEPGNLEKPSEIYDIIERFCLGRRRLQLFGNCKPAKPGWITISKNLKVSNLDVVEYNKWMSGNITSLKCFEGGELIGTTAEIENLRPKSPKNTPISTPGAPKGMMSGSGTI
jgi:N6-adenosine-specific RNA methylase IME4